MIRILLADERVVIRAGLRALFQNRSDFLICGEARDGREAIDLARQQKPDVVIINLNMPVVDGIEATRQIRRACAATEILIFTSENNNERIREALCAGARGYLLKSASDAEIVAAVEAVGRHRPFYSGAVTEQDLTRRGNGDRRGAYLTGREQEVVRLVAQGHRGKQIARLLGISLKTVNTHRSAAMRKLQLQSVAEVVRYAVREKLIHV
jgi:DNA-binding NarL/FixJ family response regulator